MQAGYLHHLNGIGSHGYRFAADVVDVALVKQVAGVLVVGAEHTPVKILGRLYQINERFQIFGGCTLPHHDELTQPQLQKGIFQIGALMVRVDTGGNIGIQILALETGGVAVDLLVMGLGGHDLGNRMTVCV